MKKLFPFFIIFVLLVGCGNNSVSQQKYDELLGELNISNAKNYELEKNIKNIQNEYKEYKKNMEKYADVIEHADEIREYEKLKSEIEKMQKIKDNTEVTINNLQNQCKELEAKIQEAKNPKPSSSVLVYSDKKVEIYFSEITSRGVVFEVKNLTDINITIQADSVAINGYSTDDITMSDDVAPKSIGRVTAKCDDFDVSEKVYTVSGQLRIIDFRSWDSYDAKFVNVEIK